MRSARREAMARLIWEAAYPATPWTARRHGFYLTDIWLAADTVLAVLDRGIAPELLEGTLQDIFYRAGVNNPLSAAARLVDGPLAGAAS